MLYRNNSLYLYRGKLLRLVSEAAKFDIATNKRWEWRYGVYESISYDEMFFKFWKSFDSFYPDKTFTELTNKAPEEPTTDV